MSEFNTAVTGSPRRRLALAVAAAVLPLMVSACASDKNIDLASYAETVEPANELYNQGLANLDAGRMGEAAKKFEAVDRQHPYSEPARKALLMSAFTNYRSAKYEEAITAGQRYVSLYPTSEDAAY